MRFIIGFLLGAMVILSAYLFLPVESMRKQAKDAINKAGLNSPELSLNAIKTEFSAILNERQKDSKTTENERKMLK